MNTRKSVAALIAASIASLASAAVFNWDGGGDGVNYEDPLNWAGDSLPGPADLVFPGGSGSSITLNSNQEVDTYRTSDGGILNHIGGTLTIGTAGPDTASFFGEFGPAGNSHIMSGTAALVVNDSGVTVWSNSGGSSDTLTMTGFSSVNILGGGEALLGSDGAFSGSLSDSASFTTANALQLARFASPSSTLSLSDSASLSVGGFLVMSDDATLSGNSTITINGSGVSVSCLGLFMREGATLSFVADASGVSTVSVNGPVELFDNGSGLDPQLSVDLSAFTGGGTIMLIDKSDGAISGQFRGLPEGAVVPGTGGRTITYAGGADGFDVVLTSSTRSLRLNFIR